jgi:hypothetical protein
MNSSESGSDESRWRAGDKIRVLIEYCRCASRICLSVTVIPLPARLLPQTPATLAEKFFLVRSIFSEIVIAAGLPVRVALGLVVIAAQSQVHDLSPFIVVPL